MNLIPILTKFCALTVAASATVSSMYVTVNAAVQQEAGVPDSAFSDATSNPEQSETTVIAAGAVVPLAPEKIVADRSHDVVLDEVGGFSGNLFSLRSGGSEAAALYTVRILQNGAVVGEAQCAEDGSFSIRGLKPGVGALVAFNSDGFVLFGVRFLAADQLHPASLQLDIQSAVIAGPDVELARNILLSGLPSGDLRFSGELAAADNSFPYGVGAPSTTIINHSVQLDANGSLQGSVNSVDPRTGRLREVLDITVHFIRDGRLVAKTAVRNDGQFTVADLQPGVYSVVGVGMDGSFALSVEAIGQGAESSVSTDSLKQYRTAAVSKVLQLSAGAASPSDFNSSNATGVSGDQTPPGPTPFAGPMGFPGGSGGGFGGGGGGGGGLGGLGLLLGGALGAGLGYLAGDNNSNNDKPATPNN